MVLLSNAGSLLIAILAASAQLGLAIPGPQGTNEAGTIGEHKEGDACDVQRDRISCASDTALLFCSNNKWVAFSDCNPGTVCKDGQCLFPDKDSADEAQSPAQGSNQDSQNGDNENDSAAEQTNESDGPSVAETSSAVEAPSAPGGDQSDTGASAAASAGGEDDSGGASAAASAGGEDDTGDASAAESAGGEENSDEGQDTGGGGQDTGGGGQDTGGGSDFGITCDKFDEAVSKASEAIGQSYPKPSQAQCNAFLKGMPKGGISSAREAAMFLANILWESDGLQAKQEYACKDKPDWCAQNYKTPEDEPGKTYWGRGYIQLTWEYNYAAASKALYGDDRLVKNPGEVSSDEDTAWAVSFWFWKANVATDPAVKKGEFGASINKINGALECKGAAQDKAKKRYEMYKAVLPVFAPGEKPIESGCYN
ncbi:hypothetical protein LPJ78_003958 [Coemansia sp. RSA 989]|nr:hypothetical protein LPJ68_002329 [Coemansia sp. RSA 1086]KAJ1863571.1 hypothetical protein LPJ78_003958 [Coemansia sp. RSA 989]